MKRDYRLILFDCFNTLFLPHEPALPRLEVDGRTVMSTAGLLQAALAPHYPDIDAATIHHALRETWRWAEGQRGTACREISAPVRMRHLFHVLGLAVVEDLVEPLVWVHMRALLQSYRLPAAHRDLLARLRERYAMAIFSNFDYAPGLNRLLQEHDLVPWFDPVVVSDTLGYRKPGRIAFERAVALAGAPAASILFVGDSYEDDVVGAVAAGIDVAWFNAAGAPPAGTARPTHELRELPALADLLA